MNSAMDRLGFNAMVAIWAGLSVLLALAGLLIFTLDIGGKVFIAMSNGLNILLFLAFLCFRAPLGRIAAKMVDQSKGLSVTIEYRHETQIGFALLLAVVAIGIFTLYTAFFDIELYRSLIREDGPVENLSALLWLLSAAALFFFVLGNFRMEARGYRLLFNAALIAFFVVCAGEEISWGQRLTGHETPGWLEAMNIQNETTLHNIGSISVFSNGFFLLTLVFFLVLPYLANKYSRVRNLLHLVRFPLPNKFPVGVYVWSLLIWIIVGLRFGTLGFHPFTFYEEQYYTQVDDEIFELLAAYSFFCFAVLHSLRTVSISDTRPELASVAAP